MSGRLLHRTVAAVPRVKTRSDALEDMVVMDPCSVYISLCNVQRVYEHSVCAVQCVYVCVNSYPCRVVVKPAVKFVRF